MLYNLFYSAFTETGATPTMNDRFQHFEIQPIKCPVENNEISTCSLWCLWCLLINCQTQYILFFSSTVCRSCIVKYLQDSEENKCPACSILIHETNPFEMLRYSYRITPLFLMYFIWRPQAETVWKQTEYRSPVMSGTNLSKAAQGALATNNFITLVFNHDPS